MESAFTKPYNVFMPFKRRIKVKVHDGVEEQA